MEKEGESMKAFDMEALRTHLPQKRGLSRFYSGKARSFMCISDVTCLEDLKKKQHPGGAKKRKMMNLERQPQQELHAHPYPCRRVSTNAQCATACVGV